MTLPENFTPAEHLQDVIRRIQNKEIRDWFSDVDFDELDISTQRGSLLTACKHADADSLIMTLLRMLLFDSLVRQRFASVEGLGIGETSYNDSVRRRLRPKIRLYFVEDAQDIEAGYSPVRGEISFRLMDHTSDSITPILAQPYAVRIQTGFANGGGFIWKRGKTRCSYCDWSKGYQLQLLCRNESEGRRVVEQVLDIQQDTPDWANFNVQENGSPAEAFPTIPQLDRVYGENRRMPRRRPVADVRFQWAVLYVAGIPNPIPLVDRSGYWPDPLVA